MKGLKKSDINILIMLAGILLAVASYFFIYSSFTEKKAVLDGENAALQAEVDELQKLADNEQFYIEETERMDTEIQEVIAQFPAEVRAEDMVLYAIKLENNNDIWVNSLSIDETTEVPVLMAAPVTNDAPVEGDAIDDTAEAPAVEEAEVPADDTAAAPAPAAGLSSTVRLYSSPFTVNYKVTYRSIKDILSDIVNADERMNIQLVDLAYDADTGCLVGDVGATMYTMPGTGKSYEVPTVNGVSIG
nr:hypothetical protein [Lachnospiraceae bacterium]